jgi:hypothetical protein
MTACRAELTLRPDEFQSTRLPQKADQADVRDGSWSWLAAFLNDVRFTPDIAPPNRNV